LEEEGDPSAATREREGSAEPSRYAVNRRPTVIASTCCFHNRKLSSKSLREIGVVK